MSKVADAVNYRPNGNGTYFYEVTKETERLAGSDSATLQEIENTIGKDMAQKIADGIGEEYDFQGKPTKELSGVNLQVGGKGMIGFYGSPKEGKLGIVGGVAKKVFKQEPKETKIDAEKKDERQYDYR